MKTESIEFYGNRIVCIETPERILVVVKTICDGLGLDSDRAIKTITDDEILGAKRSEQTVQVGDDQPRKMVCLPLEFVNGWLFQIKFTNTMSQRTREALIRYKRECYQVLHQHFFEVPSKRKQVLMQSSYVDQQLSDLEAQLLLIPAYTKFIELREERKKLNRTLKVLDEEEKKRMNKSVEIPLTYNP